MSGMETRQDAVEAPAWLNGWPQIGNGVLVHGGYCCAGCGRLLGVPSVVYDDDYEAWAAGRPTPNWPQSEGSCTVCDGPEEWEPTVVEPPSWPKGKRRPLP